MTSTNDGKDVKSNQTSGQKGKKYYLELYKSLEERLSGSETLAKRVQFLCEAWRRIHSICRHAASPSHTILQGWLERHTACALLQSQWQSPDSEAERAAFDEALVSFAQEIDSYVLERDGVRQPWEEWLLRRAEWYRSILENPWDHPVLKILLDPKETPPDDEIIIEWLKGEREAMFVRRVHELVAQRHRQCYDMAISLVAAVMDRRRAAILPLSDLEQAEMPKDAPAPEMAESSFESILRSQCGFTNDGWSFLVDVEFTLLHKADKMTRLIELAKLIPLKNGYELIESLQNRLRKAKTSREKKIWKNVNDVAILIAQITIARCMVVPKCAGVVRTALYNCACVLCALLPAARVTRDMVALAVPAATANHLYMLTKAVKKQRDSDDMKPFICELYVRAITSGMNELEKLKLKPDKEKEARQSEQTLASWFLELGSVFGSARLRGECSLTAFSVHPTMEMYERIKATPDLPPVRLAEQLQEPKMESNSKFGSWACDSRSQTNFVKTSEHLNMKQTQQANVLSTAILNEGEALGLEVELCQDIAVLLSGLRVKTLSWDLDRELLLSNCRMHMERTAGGTRALTTELRFLHLDPKDYQHLREEDDEDENDLYYGIEKGYEHLVEFPEPQPVAVWEDDLMFDEERTDSAHSTDSEEFPRKSRKKKTKKLFPSSCEDEDPLSLDAEARKKEKKKERPLSKERSKDSDKERSKDRKKKPKTEKSHSKERKKEKKERKNKIKEEKQKNGPLSQLLGVKVERPNDPQDGDYEGKSSLASLFAEPPESNIEFDGHFSMDELKSPDRKSTTPPKVYGNTVNISQTPIKQEKDVQSAENPKPHPINQGVKDRIAKLIHFRRKKSTTSTESSNSSAQSPVPQLNISIEEPKVKSEPMSNLVGSKIVNASQIPKNVLNTSQALQLSILKQEASNLLKSCSSPNQSANAAPIKSHISKTINKVTYEPANMKETCSRMVPVKSYTKNRMFSIPQLQLKYLESLSQKNEEKQVQSVSEKPTQNISPGYQYPIMPQAQQQQTHIFKQGGKPQNNLQVKQINLPKEHESQTLQSVIADQKSPEKQSLSHQRSFEDFLKVLKETSNDELSTKPTKECVRKVIKPVNKITPVVSNILKCSRATSVTNIPIASAVTPQSAKPVAQQKKAENAPNTFSRRSYMHKSKQKEYKPKLVEQHQAALNNRAALERSVSEELDKRIAELRQCKMNAKSDQTICTKLQENNKVEIIKLASPNSSLIDKHPILNDALKMKDVGNADRKIDKDTKALSTRKPSALSEKDQQDLINMLRQQNKLNEPLRHTKTDSNANFNLLQLNPSITMLTNNSTSVMANDQSPKPFTDQLVNYPPNILNQNLNATRIEKKDLNAQLISKATILKTANLIQSRIMRSQAKTAPTAVQCMSKSKKIVTKSVINVVKPKDSQVGVFLQSTPAATTLANDNQDSVRIFKQPPKLSNVEKKYEPKKNWTSVLDALRKHKTPSRGPNALEMVLNNESCERYNTQNLRNQRIVRQNSEQPIALNQDMKKPIQATVPMKTTTKVSTKPQKLAQPVQPKIQINVEFANNQPVIKIQEIPKEVKPSSQALKCETIREDDPFISGILNSEYELLEELMDDDLRKEIGELSSDEERPYTTASVAKDSKNVITNSGNNVTNENISYLMKVTDTGNPFKIQRTLLKPKDLCEISNPVTEKIVLNPNKTLDVKPTTSTSNGKPQILSNEKVSIIKRRDIVPHFPKTTTTEISQEKSNPGNTAIASKKSAKVDTKNMIITVPLQSSSDMVVIKPDMAYEPYPMLHIKEASINSNINQTYLPANNSQTVNQIQLKTFTPIVAPIIVNTTIGLTAQMPTANAPFNTGMLASKTVISAPNNTPQIKQCNATSKIIQLNATSVPDLSINLNTLAHVSSMEQKLPKTKQTVRSNTTKEPKSGKPIIPYVPKPLPVKKTDDLKIYPGPETKPKSVTPLETQSRRNELSSNAQGGRIPSKPLQQVRRVSSNNGSRICSNATSDLATSEIHALTPENKQMNGNKKDEIKSKAETSQLYAQYKPALHVESNIVLKTHEIPAQEIHHKPEIKHNIEINISKTCERKVLSEVQEKLTIPSSEKIESKLITNQRHSTDTDKIIEDTKEKEKMNDRERLKKKRLAIVNRVVNHRSFDSAIPLPYAPIKVEPLLTSLEKQSDKSVGNNVLPEKPVSMLETPTNSPIIISQLSEFILLNSGTPESPGNIENTVQKIVDKSKVNVTSVKTKKLKTKISKMKKGKTTENVGTNVNRSNKDQQEKDLTGSVTNTAYIKPTRVSSRIRERTFKKPSGIDSEKDGKGLSLTKIEQTAVALIHKKSDVQSEGVEKTQFQENSDSLEQKIVTITKGDDTFPISSEVLSSTINVNPIKSTPKLDMIKPADTSLEVQNDIIQISSSPEDIPDELTFPDLKKVANASKETDVEVAIDKIVGEIDQQKPHSVASTPAQTSVPKLITSLDDDDPNKNKNDFVSSASNCVDHKSLKSTADDKNIKVTAENINIISRDENGKSTVDIISIPAEPIFEEEIDERNHKCSKTDIIPIESDEDTALNEEFKPEACKSSVDTNESDEIPQSYKNSFIFDELPSPNPNNPSMRCVRIQIPNGKTFKATIHGQMKINFDTLFQDPALKNILLSGVTDTKRFTLSIQQTATTNHEIVDTRIKTIVCQPQKQTSSSEVVNLISDDDDDDDDHKMKKSTQQFTTEFGNYAVKSIEEDAFTKHQSKLLQKCSVKLMNCDQKQSAIAAQDPRKGVINHLINALLNPDLEENQIVPLNEVILNDSSNMLIATEIINLDESSDEDTTSKTHAVEKIDELKNLLLKDLGVADILEDSDKDAVNNQKSLSRPKRPKSQKKFKAYVETAKKDYSDIVSYECFVKLTRCDHLVRNLKEEVVGSSQKHDDAGSYFEPNLFRSGSFSILNDLQGLDDIIEQTETDMDRSSPTIDISQTITVLPGILETDDCIIPTVIPTVNKPKYDCYNTALCYSNWFDTKKDIQRRLSCYNPKSEYHVAVIDSKTDSSTDYESDTNMTICSPNVSVLQNTSVGEMSAVPSLKKLMAEYYIKDSILQVNGAKTVDKPLITCKRKSVDEYNEVANKVSKIKDYIYDNSKRGYDKVDSYRLPELETNVKKTYKTNTDLNHEIIKNHLSEISLKKIVCNYIVNNLVSVILYTKCSAQEAHYEYKIAGSQEKTSQDPENPNEIDVGCEEVGDEHTKNKLKNIDKPMDEDNKLSVKVNEAVNLEPSKVSADIPNMDSNEVNPSKLTNKEQKNTMIGMSQSNMLEESRTLQGSTDYFSAHIGQIKDQNEIKNSDSINVIPEMTLRGTVSTTSSSSLNDLEAEVAFLINDSLNNEHLHKTKINVNVDITHLDVSVDVDDEKTKSLENESIKEYLENRDDKSAEIPLLGVEIGITPERVQTFMQNLSADADDNIVMSSENKSIHESADIPGKPKETTQFLGTNTQSSDQISDNSCDINIPLTTDTIYTDFDNQDLNADMKNEATIPTENKPITKSSEELHHKPVSIISSEVLLNLSPKSSYKANYASPFKQSDCPGTSLQIAKDCLKSDVNIDQSRSYVGISTENKSILESLEKLEDEPVKITFPERPEMTLKAYFTKIEISNYVADSDVSHQDVIANVEDKYKMFSENKSITEFSEAEPIKKPLLQMTPNALKSNHYDNCDLNIAITKNKAVSVVLTQKTNADMEIGSTIFTENITKSCEQFDDKPKESNSDTNFAVTIDMEKTEISAENKSITQFSQGLRKDSAKINSHAIPVKAAPTTSLKAYSQNSFVTSKVTTDLVVTNKHMTLDADFETAKKNQSVMKCLEKSDKNSVEITSEELKDIPTKVNLSEELLEITAIASYYKINSISEKISDMINETTDAITEITTSLRVTNIDQDVRTAKGIELATATEKNYVAKSRLGPEDKSSDFLPGKIPVSLEIKPETSHETFQNVDQIALDKTNELQDNLDVIFLTSFDLKVNTSEGDSLKESENSETSNKETRASNLQEKDIIPNACLDGNENLTSLGIKVGSSVTDIARTTEIKAVAGGQEKNVNNLGSDAKFSSDDVKDKTVVIDYDCDATVSFRNNKMRAENNSDHLNEYNSQEKFKINRACGQTNVADACENDDVKKIMSDKIDLDDEQITLEAEHFKIDQSKYYCETKIVEDDTVQSPRNSADGSAAGSPVVQEGCVGEVFNEKVSDLYRADTGVFLKNIEYNDAVVGTHYVFALDKSNASSVSSSTSSITGKSGEMETQMNETHGKMLSTETKRDNGNSMDSNKTMEVLVPKQTYSRRKLKRKQVMGEISLSVKKRRFSKLKNNIESRKLSYADICDSLYMKEFTSLLEYCSNVEFSYSISFHKDQVDVENVFHDWPIKGGIQTEPQEPRGRNEVDMLFQDLNVKHRFDPFTQTLTEELNTEYVTEESWESEDSNFNMGFGEGSGRVNQNLGSGGVTKFSAVTLSDVKHSQPFLLSEDYDDCCIEQGFISQKMDQIEKIQRSIAHIKLRDKVRSFFKKTALELNRDIENVKEKEHISDSATFPFDLFIPKSFQPKPVEVMVQVVQVGQLPVSAAAQNPVTCDPRVTQVSDASPSQCSEENSPRDDSQQGIKTEYTELTTADLSMPLETYQNHSQTMLIETREAKTGDNIPIETELIKSEVKIELVEETSEDTKIDEKMDDACDLPTSNHVNHTDYTFDSNSTNASMDQDTNMQAIPPVQDIYSQQKQQNGAPEKTDQIAHAMNAAGISTTAEPVQNTRAQALVNIISQKIRHSNGNAVQNTMNTYSKSSPITAMALQQALAQILPPPLNQVNASEGNQQGQNPTVTPQVLHIVQGKNASGNQITLVDNTQQSVINQNATPVLHIVQNKGPNTASNPSGNTSQQQAFSSLSLVDTGIQQGGNQLLHIVNTGNQKNTNSGQLLKRVNLLTNLTNVPGSNDQKMVQFVCKSADGKSIQLNAPHQRSMVLRLQPIESPNVQPIQPKPMENQDMTPPSNTPNSGQNKDSATSQQEIKSRSMYEENYAKFIQNSTTKPIAEKSTSLPKFNQAFGKSGFLDGNQKPSDITPNNNHLSPTVNTNNDNAEGPPADNNSINLEHISQMNSPPLLLRKSPQTSQPQQNLVQQIKQTIAPMNIQTMHGGVIYTRQIPVNIGGGQTINLITVPSTELIDDKQQPEVKFVNQSKEIEPSIIKIVPQSQPAPNAEVTQEETNNQVNMNNDNAQTPQPQPVLTQMRIKLPMLSKTPQVVSGARVVRPSFFQIQRNVIGGANQQVYQQLVLTAAPSLGQQTIRLPQGHAARPVKVPSETQSSPESQMSSSTLEQLREFDMVLEQVKERSTVQPNTGGFKLNTTSSDATDSSVSGSSTPVETSQPVLYSIGGSQQLNVAYVNRKATVATPSTSTFVRSPDSTGIADSPNSSNQAQTSQSVSNEPSSSGTSSQSRPRVSSKSKSRPKSSSHSQVKINSVPPKPTTQKPLEDEQTTQRILYILAEYKEQVENSPDKDKPAPRRRSNPPSNPGSSKRKKSSSGSRRPGARDVSPVQGDDTCRTMGSEDSSCGTSQGDCTESCMETHSPQDSPRKVARKLTFEQDVAVNQPRPQPQRNVIVADGQTITVARGAGGKPATAVLMPANYILPVSMVKGGQQIAIVTNRGPKLLTVGGGEGGATNALLLQRLISPAGLKPVLARPGVRHVRLPTAALHNLHTFNLASATIQPPDSTASPAPVPTPPELIENRAENTPWAERESENVRPERPSSPEGSEPWNMPTSSEAQEYSYEETVRAENMDRTVLDPIPDRYSPDMEAQRIFDKMFDVESKKCFIVDSHDEPHCGYVDASEDDKGYQVTAIVELTPNKASFVDVHASFMICPVMLAFTDTATIRVVQKKEGPSHRQHRVTHISAAALRHKYAILEHELRLQKSLSEECEDLGVDSPSASELFPEAELLFAASPAQDPGEASHHNPHTPQPTLNQTAIQADIDDQIATDQLIPRAEAPQVRPELDVNLGLGDVGIVTVSEDGMQATIALDQEEFARSHPNTTFHSEPTEGEVQQPFTITGIKGGRQISTIFHANRAPATVLMTAPQATGTVISQTAGPPPVHQGSIKYSDIDHMIGTLPGSHHNNVNLNSVLVKDDGLTRYDNILTDSRELHLSNTASAIVHPTGNATQVIRRVCYDEEKRERDVRYLMDESDTLIAGDDAKMVAEDSSRDATMESIAEDVDDDISSPGRHAELFWESNSASERSESRRPLDFSSDSEKGCKSPSYDETNSTDSSGVGSHVRHDSVIKEARFGRSGSAEGSSADDTHPPLRTYPPKRMFHNPEAEMERSLSGKTRAGEHSPDLVEGRRRTSVRGVVKRGCHCCNGSPSPAPPRSKKPRQRKPTLDFNNST